MKHRIPPRIPHRLFTKPIDFSKVETLVYHLPNGPTFTVQVDAIEDFIDIDMELGEVCDTSEIDGVLHFFPKGNA